MALARPGKPPCWTLLIKKQNKYKYQKFVGDDIYAQGIFSRNELESLEKNNRGTKIC